MAPKQKLTYLWNGLMWRRWGVESVIAIITKKIKMIACHFYLAVGSRLPPELQLIYFLERSGWAARQSVPQVYPGHLIVFPTEERSNYARSEWGRLAGRGVDIHVVPGNHSNVLKEPNVRVVAQKLRRCLSEAQAKANTDCGEFATLSSN
jgi:hypothetical protein